MNLTEALDNALPEIPVMTREFHPKLDPKLLVRERTEGGVTTVIVLTRTGYICRFTPQQWRLLQLFDGKRSLEEVSQLYSTDTGMEYTVEELRESVATLDESDFWFKTPLEVNIALKQRLADERQKKVKKKSRWGDLAHVEFPAWDPDSYLEFIYPKVKFIYTNWFTVLSFAGFLFMLYIFLQRWDEIGTDTLLFYNFKQKGLRDIAEFWMLSASVLFVHESAHGLACKHYGGRVRKMGFLLMYLMPCFYTDATEAFLYGDKWQRVKTVAWGAWSEVLVCVVCTPIWWATPYGSFVHDFSYKLMLMTGLAAFFFNWNPLVKLDGYYLLTESFSLPGLKEESTAFLAACVKKHVWGLPVEVPFVPRRRRLGYAIYALLSGAYSYTLLFFFSRFTANVARAYSPEWGFLVGLAIGYRIFRSRIRTLVRFMKTVYLDRKEAIRAWFTPTRRAFAGLVVAVVVFAPVFRESLEGRFLLEPLRNATVRTPVPGRVEAIYADEGQHVVAGAPLAQLRNLRLETEAGKAQADYRVALARVTQAQLRYTALGPASQDRDRLAATAESASEKLANLRLTSPIDGIVVTPRVRDRLGSYLDSGTVVAEIADMSRMRARIYVSEYQMRKAKVGATARLLCDSSLSVLVGQVTAISPVSSEIAGGLIEQTPFKGIRAPSFYVFDIEVNNPSGKLRNGMSGTAQVYGQRHSIGGYVWEGARDMVFRKIW